MFKGGFDLSMALGGLSDDGCVPLLLVVWLEAFQHQRLQAGG